MTKGFHKSVICLLCPDVNLSFLGTIWKKNGVATDQKLPIYNVNN